MTRSVYTPKYKQLCKMLVEERQKANLSQASLSSKLGVNQTYVSKYELGERRLDIIELMEIADAIGFDILALIKKLQ